MFPVDAYVLEKNPPAIVYVSPKETHEEGWGYVQFPSLQYLPNGNMLLSFQVAEDSAESYGKNSYKYFLCTDDGAQWKELESNSKLANQAYPGINLQDGSSISIETTQAPKIDSISLPENPFTWIPYDYTYSEPEKAYLYQDLPKELQTISIRRVDSSGNFTLEKAPIELVRNYRMVNDDLLPIIFFGPLKRLPNGEIIGVFYPGYSANEKGSVDIKTGTLLVHSKDNGKTWKEFDKLPYRPDRKYDPKADMRGGFTEPAAELLEDGSLLLVLRTADATPEPFPGFVECGPLYSAFRSEKGEWSTPTPISPYGVMPQLLKLKNGMIVLSYGRPGIQVRISADNGKKWTGPFDILKAELINQRAQTCGYSSIIEDHKNPYAFYIAYSNFHHLGADNKRHKAIYVQKCLVKGPFQLPDPPKEENIEVDEVIEHYYHDHEQALAVRIRLHNKKLQGLTEGFYQTGVASFVTPYLDGKIHGTQKFFAPEGYLMKSIPYVKGKKHGVIRQYDQKGNILREIFKFEDEDYSAEDFFAKTAH